MMSMTFPCEMCGADTGFCINGVPYCSEHAFEGIGVQARLAASLKGADSEAIREMGRWAQHEVASMFGFPPDE